MTPTRIGQVQALIGGIDADDALGPIDINVIGQLAEVNLGTSWATLDHEGVCRLIIDLHDAALQLQAAAHARRVVDEALPGVWPT